MIYIFYVKRTHRVLIVRESDNIYSNDREISQNKDDEKEEVSWIGKKGKRKIARNLYINLKLYSRIKKSSFDLINFRNLELD